MKDGKLKKTLVNIYEKMYVYGEKMNDYKLKKQLGTPLIMTIDETLDYILKNKCSVSRFGDGELKIVVGDGIRFQKYDPVLAQRLQEILKQSSSNHLVCVTDIFDNIRWMMPTSYEYTWRVVAKYRESWTKFLDLKRQYGNTFMTRCYMDHQNKSSSQRWFKKLKEIWEKQEIVFVEGEKSRLGYRNDLFNNVISIERILCPAKDAFSYYDDILQAVLKLNKNKLILLALGPTATVLAYDLSKLGYRALDIGHVDIEYEWFLRGATEKIRIEYKYTNEALGGDSVEKLYDFEYKSQIIGCIGCSMEC